MTTGQKLKMSGWETSFFAISLTLNQGKKRFIIWALTDAITIRVASIVYRRPPAFQERRPTFWKGISDKDLAKL
jgi:hypothetical protein